jgi:enoyl-CoA hydratase/carnithine racemase
MKQDTVLYELHDRVCVITLNRPESMNAFNRALKAELKEVLAHFDADDEARVAILTGAGRAFSAGRDLKERAEDNALGIKAKPADSMSPNSLYSFPTPAKPIIAAINGHCLAGGFSLAQMCDLRVAAENAMMGITEPRVGLMGPFGAQLPRLIPTALALEMILTAEPITAQRAYEFGFVNRVVPLERLMDEALSLAQQIARNAPLSVLYAKELAYRSLDLDDRGILSLTEHVYARLLDSEDSKEGPRAFVEKRQPNWQGR